MALDAVGVRYELFVVMVVVRSRLVADSVYAWRLKRGAFGKKPKFFFCG